MLELTVYPSRKLTVFEQYVYDFVTENFYDINPFQIDASQERWGPEWSKYYDNPIRNTLIYYSPTITPEQAAEGSVEINVVTKKGPTGKRTTLKMGKFMSKAFPFLSDTHKEKFVTSAQESHKPFNAEFHITDTGFAKVVTMPSARSLHFVTTRYQKNLNNSCMRYDCSYFGLDRHPYEAYESGEFQMAYLTQDKKLAGRVIIHTPSETYSAIYGTSQQAVVMLKSKMVEFGYTPVDEDGSDWEGAKLLHIETNYADPDCEGEDDQYTANVLLAPYLDFWEGEKGYSDGTYIHLTDDPNDSWIEVDMQDGAGYNEW